MKQHIIPIAIIAFFAAVIVWSISSKPHTQPKVDKPISTVAQKPTSNVAKPIQTAPKQIEEDQPPRVPDPPFPCLFGVVYYSYYSPSENKTYYEFVTSDVFPQSLSRKQQEQILDSLARDCGPVGANVVVSERKIITARTRREASYKWREMAANYIKSQPISN